MTEYLELQSYDCKHCYKCIRNCPVKAIRFSDNQANIMQEECVLCGRCFVSCPQNAKRIHNDLPRAKALVAGDAPVYVSLAPSFVANYEGATIESMAVVFAQLGFAGAEETALGATLVKQQYDEMVRKAEQSVMISTCCHTVNMLVERHYPVVLSRMANVVSPMQAHAKALQKAHPGCKVVFVGPCISKKAEADQCNNDVNCVLTFDELDVWLFEAGLSIEPSADAKTTNAKGKARLFPTAGGVLRTMAQDNPDYDYIAIDGMENCIAALDDIAAGNLKNCFIEMSACSGSCINGPAMSHKAGLVRGVTRVNAYAANEDFAVEPLPEDAMKKSFRFQMQPHPNFGHKAIEDVLRKIGKTKPEDELNCGTCGYDTCRQKAAAVLAGKASLEMCLPHLMSKAQSFSDTIIKNTPNGIMVLNEALEIQQINESACQILNIRKPTDILGENIVCLMEPTQFLRVLDGEPSVHDVRQYLADYDRHVMLSVIPDKDYGLLIAIMRDVTDRETAREAKRELADKTIRVTDEVIARQMRTVQEIASLLGETAAETKIALTKLKETLHND